MIGAGRPFQVMILPALDGLPYAITARFLTAEAATKRALEIIERGGFSMRIGVAKWSLGSLNRTMIWEGIPSHHPSQRRLATG